MSPDEEALIIRLADAVRERESVPHEPSEDAVVSLSLADARAILRLIGKQADAL
jgi:hypothetical protein